MVTTELKKDTLAWSKQIVSETGSQSNFFRCRGELKDNGKCDKSCDFEEFGYDFGECLCENQLTCAEGKPTNSETNQPT